MSKISGGDFEYIPQVDIGAVIERGQGWLKDGEKSLISLDDLCDINDIVKYGRKLDFREEKITDTYWTIRWFYLPRSYLINLWTDNLTDFVQLKDQLKRYLDYLRTVVYPTYRKNDNFIEWKNE